MGDKELGYRQGAFGAELKGVDGAGGGASVAGVPLVGALETQLEGLGKAEEVLTGERGHDGGAGLGVALGGEVALEGKFIGALELGGEVYVERVGEGEAVARNVAEDDGAEEPQAEEVALGGILRGGGVGGSTVQGDAGGYDLGADRRTEGVATGDVEVGVADIPGLATMRMRWRCATNIVRKS